jgi:uncharacterized protein (DUF4415 family)
MIFNMLGFTAYPAQTGNKQQVTLRIDQAVLAFFKERGKGYQKLINAICNMV